MIASPSPRLISAARDHPWGRALRSPRVLIGGGLLLAIALASVLTLPMTLGTSSSIFFDRQDSAATYASPNISHLSDFFGHDLVGRSLFGRALLGGALSLGIGIGAAMISVVLGVGIGLVAGYQGGWLDALLMRSVDVLYGLPYILLVVLFKIAFEDPLKTRLGWSPAIVNLLVLFVAIGAVSWLTMARVVRGQVMSLRAQPYIEAARASGLRRREIFLRHILPNLVGPVIVYATLIVPQAILQESFLSFLGIGIAPPMPTWGSLAADGLMPALNTVSSHWWLLLFPCILLAVTLLCLNFVGDGLRDVFDPRAGTAKL